MKKTTLFARLLAGIMTVFFLMGGGVSCSDGSDKDNTPETKSYTVTFDSDGGSDVASQTVEAGKTATKPEDPTNGDAPFLNWLKDGKPFLFSTPITADITLTAEWGTPGATVYTIIFNSDGGTAIDSQKVESGKTAEEPTDDPTKDGYTFIGWFKDEDENPFDFTNAITENITLTAKWEAVTTEPGGDEEEEKPPVIGQPVEGGVEILTAYGGLEAAYVTFKPVENAVSYNVYYIKAGDTAVKLDAPLVREYKDYLRADAVGLAAGEYTLKVVAVDYENNEVIASANQATMTVKAHTREGYAFVNAEAGKSASGAYNDDGTLRSNARVIYVTNDNKDTVKLNIMQDKAETEYVGVQKIIEGYKKRKDNRPLAIRFIGNITDPANMPKGDLYVDGVVNGMTIEGIGNDATMNGFGIVVKNSSYVEIRNLGFMNCDSDEGDNVGLQQDIDHIWVHNCDMFYGGPGGDSDQAKGDGALDTKKAHYITHSYNHFWDNGKCNLQGANESDTSNYITYHHNWYDHSDSRHPRIRVATVHVYNNYYDGNAKYGIGATTGASVFAESNYFRSTANMKPMMIALQGTDPLTAENPSKGTFSSENGGIIKAYGNKFDCPDSKLQFLPYNAVANDIKLDMYKTLDTTVEFDAYVVTDRNAQVPNTVKAKKGGAIYNNFDTASDFYKYSPDSADEAKANVIKYAGRVDGGDFKFTFNNATEDSNSGIIKELKTKLTSYKDSIVKVFGIEAYMGDSSGSGSTGEGSGSEGGNESGGTTTNPPAPIEGEVVYNPATSGADGTYGIFTVTGGYKSGSTEVTINGVTIPSGKAVKFNSGGSVSFTVDKTVTLTVYINKNGIKINNGDKITGTQSGTYYVITTELEAGSYTVKQGDGESQLYMLTLIPKS